MMTSALVMDGVAFARGGANGRSSTFSGQHRCHSKSFHLPLFSIKLRTFNVDNTLNKWKTRCSGVGLCMTSLLPGTDRGSPGRSNPEGGTGYQAVPDVGRLDERGSSSTSSGKKEKRSSGGNGKERSSSKSKATAKKEYVTTQSLPPIACDSSILIDHN